jgi:septum formation protein
VRSKIIETHVRFKALTLNEIKRYWQTGEPCDKAGSYAIQGIGGQFVTTINGSYSAVVGLPLYETAMLLAKSGLPTTIQYNG